MGSGLAQKTRAKLQSAMNGGVALESHYKISDHLRSLGSPIPAPVQVPPAARQPVPVAGLRAHPLWQPPSPSHHIIFQPTVE
eukprot:2055761-Rhodomonas_salina.2